MSLTGDLRTMSLPDVLQWISAGRKTGTLHVRAGSVHKNVAFQDGAIASSSSNDPRESLSQFLMRERRLSEEQLFRAMLLAEEDGRPLGTVLVTLGILEEQQLRDTLQRKAEETVYDLFLWPEGRFEFAEGEVPPEASIAVHMPVTAVLLEGMRRVDEWSRIRDVFPTAGASFALAPAARDEADGLERQALDLAAYGRTLAEMSLELYLSEFDTAALFYRLWQRGSVAVAQTGRERPPADPIGTIRDLLTAAYQHLEEKYFDAAQKAYEEVLTLDRINQHAKKGLLAVAEARARSRSRREVALDGIPRLTLDLETLTDFRFDPQEAFVLSRINGAWDVQSILKLCPMEEDQALMIFGRLLDWGVIELRAPRAGEA
jgi:hypothetical protein